MERDYSFDKYWNYFFAIAFLLGGVFFLYKTLLSNWSENMQLSLLIFTILISLYMIYLGILGFLRTPLLSQINVIPINASFQNKKEKILEVSRKNNLFLLPNVNDNNILRFETKNLIFEKREIIFFIDENGIYLNIQQRNWNGPTFMGYNGSKKIMQKLKMEIKDSR